MLETNSRLQNLANRSPDLHHLTDEDLVLIHKCLIGMLSDIDRVCMDHGLCYCLYAGTMLGAVRHSGFIPWDDDLDLCMPRKDYDRFAEIFPAECGGDYWVQEARRDPSYDLSFMKVRRKGTRFREFTEPGNDKAGLFIDIFPMENVPDGRLLRGVHALICDGLLFICSCVRISNKKELLLRYCAGSEPVTAPGRAGGDTTSGNMTAQNDPEDSLASARQDPFHESGTPTEGDDAGRERISLARQIRLKAAIGRIFGIVPLHRWLVLTDRAAALCGNERSRYVTIPSGKRHSRGERCLRAWVLPTVPVSFEGHSYAGCADPDEVLKTMYGDYMQLPPADEREHHSLLEFEIP